MATARIGKGWKGRPGRSVVSAGTPLSRDEHPRLALTLDNRATTKARVVSGGEWNSEFQTYITYLTDTAVWNSISTNAGLLSLWAAGAGFVYQMFEGGAPSGITFPAHADTQAEWGTKGVEWLMRVHDTSQDTLVVESYRGHFFAYDWLHAVLSAGQKTTLVGDWKTYLDADVKVQNSEATYPAYTNFNYGDSEYSAKFGYWVLAGLASLGDGIADTWAQTGVDRYDFAFRNPAAGAQAQITKETARAGLDGGYIQGFNYSGYIVPRVAPVEIGYRTALGISALTHYGDADTAGWVRGWVPYLVRMIRPWAKVSSGPDGRAWLMAMELGGQIELAPFSSNQFRWPALLARKEFQGVDQDTADLAAWFLSKRGGDDTNEVEWVFTRFLGAKGTEKSPTTLSLAGDKAFSSGKWQWRTGWASINDALIQVSAFRFGALGGAGRFTIDYGGPALPLGPARNHDFDNSPVRLGGNVLGFVDPTRTTLEVGAESDDYGYQRILYTTSASLALTASSNADYLDPATVKFRTTTDDSESVGYLSLDLARSYNSDAVSDGQSAIKVSAYERKFIYFPPTTPGTDSVRLFLFDFATAKSTTYQKRQTFLSYAEPVIDGSAAAGPSRSGSTARKTTYTGATVISSAQSGTESGSTRLFITPLAPTGFEVVKVNYRYTDGVPTNYFETPYGFPSLPDVWGGSSVGDLTAYNAFWRIEVIPTVLQVTDSFCTALESFVDSSAVQTATTAVTGTGIVGGRIGDAVGAHLTTDGGTSCTVILPDVTQTCKVYIGGLAVSAARTISKGASVGTVTHVATSDTDLTYTTTAQGTLYVTAVVTSGGNAASRTLTLS